jgi:CRP/FNR family cyclic AMP-dependent transcriptional regulator
MSAAAEREVVDVLAVLRHVDYLESLDDETLLEVAGRARRMRYASGERIVSELESGADVFVLLEGRSEVSVEPRGAARRVLCTLTAGAAFGEMSSLTGELRSATVTAITDVEVLVVTDADFDALRERRPAIAVAMLRVIARRLAEAERSLDVLLDSGARGAEDAPLSAIAERAHQAGGKIQRGSLGRVWRELVVGRQRDLAFLTLASFVVMLVLVRVSVHVAFRFDLAPREVLRAAYMSGFALLVTSAAVSLLRFREGWRRVIALAYGAGMALIFNELGVTLAFDIFYKDIHTADPNAPFDVERLYQRTEALRAIVIGLVVLVQAAYLRSFYRRVWFIAKTRLRKVATGSRS